MAHCWTTACLALTAAGMLVACSPPTEPMQQASSGLTDAVACPPIAGAVLTITPSYQPYRALMARIFSKGPVYVTSSSVVPNCARKQASAMLTMMLRKRPKVAERLRGQGALTAVVGRTQNICELPYWADLTGSPCEAQGGLGGIIGRPAHRLCGA